MKAVVRYALPGLLALSWMVAAWLMWDALTTVPSAERLARSHMVRIPTPQTFAFQLGSSAVELGIGMALTWPGRRLLLRLWAATLAAWIWFFASAPLGLNSVQWVHRRWLAAVALWLLVTALVASLRALLRRFRSRTDRPATP